MRSGSGADWLTVRANGVFVPDVWLTFVTHDGALIYTAYAGLADLGPDGYHRFLAGEPLPDGTPIRTTPTYQTSHPAYQWLTRPQCIGIGQIFRSRSEVCYDIYALR